MVPVHPSSVRFIVDGPQKWRSATVEVTNMLSQSSSRRGRACVGVAAVLALLGASVLAFAAAIPPRLEVRLKSRTFVPAPGIAAEALPATRSVHALVQFERALRKEDHERLRRAGIHLGDFLGGQAYFARLEPNVGRERLLAAGPVRAVASIAWPDKCARSLLTDSPQEEAHATAGGRLKLVVVSHLGVPEAEMTAELVSSGYSPEALSERVFEVSVPRGALEPLARLDRVQWVEPGPPPPVPTNHLVRSALRVNEVQRADLSGPTPHYHRAGHTTPGQPVRMAASEVYPGPTTHPDFDTRVTGNYLGAHPHATHVMGTMLGSGSRSAALGGSPWQWRGMAPEAEGYFTSTSLSRANYQTLVASGVDLVNNSWRGGYGGWYTSQSVLFDGWVRGDAGRALNVVISSANEGEQTLFHPLGYFTISDISAAKNVLTVGALNSDTDAIAQFSSKGPARDGRIKPELVGPGCTQGVPLDRPGLDVWVDFIEIVESNIVPVAAASEPLLDAAELPRPPRERVLVRWAFDTDGDVEGWSTGGRLVQPPEAVGGNLHYRVWGGSHVDLDRNVSLTANDRQFVRARIRIDGRGVYGLSGGVLYWTIADRVPQSNWVDALVGFPIQADNLFHTYRIPVPDGVLLDGSFNPTGAPGWVGSIGIFRLAVTSPSTTITSTVPPDGYAASCGTSMSAPAVSGAAALALDDYRARFSGTPDPAPATVKAILIHTARDLVHTRLYPGETIRPTAVTYGAGPDFATGYGIPMARRAVDLLAESETDPALVRAETIEDTGTELEYPIEVPAGATTLKTTLVWTDPPGAPNAAQALVNDLDLRLIDPSGRAHFPWVLDPAQPEAAASQGCPLDCGAAVNQNVCGDSVCDPDRGEDPLSCPADCPSAGSCGDGVCDIGRRELVRDDRNNLEQVHVSEPTPGTWRVRLTATRLSVPFSTALCAAGAVCQPFSLVTSVDPRPFAADRWIEAEDGGLTGSMRTGHLADARGDRVYVVADESANGHVAFDVEVVEEGFHLIDAIVRAEDASGDSFGLQLTRPGGGTSAYTLQIPPSLYGRWVLRASPTITQAPFLLSGRHRIRVDAVEAGARLDSVRLRRVVQLPCTGPKCVDRTALR
jgi:subtilisin family serine protease